MDCSALRSNAEQSTLHHLYFFCVLIKIFSQGQGAGANHAGLPAEGGGLQAHLIPQPAEGMLAHHLARHRQDRFLLLGKQPAQQDQLRVDQVDQVPQLTQLSPQLNVPVLNDRQASRISNIWCWAFIGMSSRSIR